MTRAGNLPSSGAAQLTVRKRIAEILSGRELTARDLSGMLGIKEREVMDHLPHVEKSSGNGATIIARPAACLGCGFVFKKRRRLTTPGRCPVCRSEQITPPMFAVPELKSEGERKSTKRRP
jgi:transcriptional regulator